MCCVCLQRKRADRHISHNSNNNLIPMFKLLVFGGKIMANDGTKKGELCGWMNCARGERIQCNFISFYFMFSTVQKYGFIYGFIQRFMLFMAIPGTKRNDIKLLKRFSHSVSLSAIDPFGLRATKILSFFMQCNLNNITTQKHI